MLLRIGGGVRIVLLQFSFAKRHLVPGWLYAERHETPSDRVKRKTNPVKGVELITPTTGVDLRAVPESLESIGFALIDAFSQERLHGSRRTAAGNPETYQMVRFVFGRERSEGSSLFFEILDSKGKEALRKFLSEANWRVRAYQNPTIKDDEPVPGVSSISINLEVREPYFDRHGNPIRREAAHLLEIAA